MIERDAYRVMGWLVALTLCSGCGTDGYSVCGPLPIAIDDSDVPNELQVALWKAAARWGDLLGTDAFARDGEHTLHVEVAPLESDFAACTRLQTYLCEPQPDLWVRVDMLHRAQLPDLVFHEMGLMLGLPLSDRDGAVMGTETMGVGDISAGEIADIKERYGI